MDSMDDVSTERERVAPSLPLADLRGVGLIYQPDSREAVIALTDCNLQVFEGEVVCIIGPSGCGKTSVLSLLAGHFLPSAGQVLFAGQPVTGPGPDRGIIFQASTLFPWMTVQKNVETGSRLQQMSSMERKREAAKFLSEVGLAKAGHLFPHDLSGGMAQRAEVARAVINHPRLLLADEPFGSLDALTRKKLQAWFAEFLRQRLLTCLLTTHAIVEGLLLGDRIAVMSETPGHIQRIIENPFSRPDRLSKTNEPEFRALHAEIESMLLPSEAGENRNMNLE